MPDGGSPTEVRLVSVALIQRDPHQPRRTSPDERFDVSDLLPLIKEQGVLTALDVGPSVRAPFRLGSR